MAKRTEHHKLVRDKIPDIIRASGGRPSVYTLAGRAKLLALLDKLVEEAEELRTAVVENSGIIGERADIAEVSLALDKELGLTSDDIEAARQEKADARGGFEKGIFLEYVDEP